MSYENARKYSFSHELVGLKMIVSSFRSFRPRKKKKKKKKKKILFFWGEKAKH